MVDKIERLLYEYPYVQRRVDSITMAISVLEAQVEGVYDGLHCPISRFGDAPMTTGRVGDPTGQAAILLCDHLHDKINRLKAEKTHLQSWLLEVDTMLHFLTDTEKRIVVLKFFLHHKAKDIAAVMKCTRQNCHHHLRKAMEKMDHYIKVVDGK